MSSPSHSSREPGPVEPGVACQPRACQFCRVRKVSNLFSSPAFPCSPTHDDDANPQQIKCDKAEPSCSTCEFCPLAVAIVAVNAPQTFAP